MRRNLISINDDLKNISALNNIVANLVATLPESIQNNFNVNLQEELPDSIISILDPEESDILLDGVVNALLTPDTCDMQKSLIKTIVASLDLQGDAGAYQKLLLS